jgi:hypothetical protein
VGPFTLPASRPARRHPGYWRKSPCLRTALKDVSTAQDVGSVGKTGISVHSPLQDLLTAQPTVLIGLIAHLAGDTATRRHCPRHRPFVTPRPRHSCRLRGGVGARRGTTKSSGDGQVRPRAPLPSACSSIFCSTRAASIFRPDHENLQPLARRTCQDWPRSAATRQGLVLIGPSTAARSFSREEGVLARPISNRWFSPIFPPLLTKWRGSRRSPSRSLLGTSNNTSI